MNPSPKKRYDPLNESNYKLNLDNIVICNSSECILFSAFPKPTCPSRQPVYIKSHNDILLDVKDADKYLCRVQNISSKEIVAIEKKTVGQSDNPDWFSYT